MPRKPKSHPEKTPPPATSKGWDNDFSDYGRLWSPLGGGAWGRGTDGPTAHDLIGAFADTVYSCASIIATSLAAIDLRLVAETKTGQALPRQPNHPVREVPDWRRKSGLRAKSMTLQEVADHPLLDLLYLPNPDASYTDLITATSIYLEIVGRAFWLVTDSLGLPERIDLLPAHLVATERDATGRAVRYVVGTGQDRVEYEPGRVVAFRRHHQMDPAGEGVSPLKAVWQQVSLSNAEIASWESIVGQLAQPMVMLTPAPGEVLGEDNANRIAKEMTSRFYGSGKGGIWVNTDHLQMQAISWPPKDMSGLSLQQHLKDRICNAYHLPRTLLDTQDASYASSKATERTFQMFCLKPRITYLLERITHALVRRYDTRLFLAPGEFIQQDESVIVQMRQTAVTSYQAGISTKNESRAAFGLDPVPDGNTYAPVPDLNPFTMGKSKGVEAKYDAYPLQPLVAALQAHFARQAERQGSKAVEDDEELANALFPLLRAWYEAAAERWRAGSTATLSSPWEIVQEGLGEAARKAALELARSTNETTSLEISAAKERLREELAAGLEEGEAVNELTRRVQAVFERASTQRAYLIADTERTRAINEAEGVTAKGAGLTEKTWLADSMACPVCRGFNGRTVGIDEPFGVDPKGGPYAVKQAPPAHPGCRCVTLWGRS